MALILNIFNSRPAFNADRSFADWLFENGYYDLALAEYMKIHYHSYKGDIIDSTFIELDVAKCYLMLGKFAEGINWCEKVGDTLSSSRLPELLILHARLLMKAGRISEALQVLSRAETFIKADKKGYISFLRGCIYAWEWQHNEAITHWQQIPLSSPLKEQANHYAQISIKAMKLKFLNPTKGAIMGIIPGAGYLYAGHRQTAFAAVIVIGLTSWGTYASFKKEVKGLGFLGALLTIGWYSGNIYGSYWACVRSNKMKRESLLKEINF